MKCPPATGGSHTQVCDLALFCVILCLFLDQEMLERIVEVWKACVGFYMLETVTISVQLWVGTDHRYCAMTHRPTLLHAVKFPKLPY